MNIRVSTVWSLSEHRSGLKILPAIQNSRSNAAEKVSTARYCLASFLRVGQFSRFAANKIRRLRPLQCTADQSHLTADCLLMIFLWETRDSPYKGEHTGTLPFWFQAIT